MSKYVKDDSHRYGEYLDDTVCSKQNATEFAFYEYGRCSAAFTRRRRGGTWQTERMGDGAERDAFLGIAPSKMRCGNCAFYGIRLAVDIKNKKLECAPVCFSHSPGMADEFTPTKGPFVSDELRDNIKTEIVEHADYAAYMQNWIQNYQDTGDHGIIFTQRTKIVGPDGRVEFSIKSRGFLLPGMRGWDRYMHTIAKFRAAYRTQKVQTERAKRGGGEYDSARHGPLERGRRRQSGWRLVLGPTAADRRKAAAAAGNGNGNNSSPAPPPTSPPPQQRQRQAAPVRQVNGRPRRGAMISPAGPARRSPVAPSRPRPRSIPRAPQAPQAQARPVVQRPSLHSQFQAGVDAVRRAFIESGLGDLTTMTAFKRQKAQLDKDSTIMKNWDAFVADKGLDFKKAL